jgi:hypothetical protein
MRKSGLDEHDALRYREGHPILRRCAMRAKERSEFFTQAADAMTLWAETGQTVVRQGVDFGIKAAEEGTRLVAAVQAAGLEVAKDGQDWTRRLMGESLDESRKVFGHLADGAQAVAAAAQGVQAAGDAAAVEIRTTVTEAAAKVFELATPAKG